MFLKSLFKKRRGKKNDTNIIYWVIGGIGAIILGLVAYFKFLAKNKVTPDSQNGKIAEAVAVALGTLPGSWSMDEDEEQVVNLLKNVTNDNFVLIAQHYEQLTGKSLTAHLRTYLTVQQQEQIPALEIQKQTDPDEGSLWDILDDWDINILNGQGTYTDILKSKGIPMSAYNPNTNSFVEKKEADFGFIGGNVLPPDPSATKTKTEMKNSFNSALSGGKNTALSFLSKYKGLGSMGISGLISSSGSTPLNTKKTSTPKFSVGGTLLNVLSPTHATKSIFKSLF